MLLEEATAKLKAAKQKTLPGEVAFRLYDTYGFPLDLTEDILSGEDMVVDQAGFAKLMEEQRTRGREAREASQHGIERFSSTAQVCFTGYDRLEGESTVLAIYDNGDGQTGGR